MRKFTLVAGIVTMAAITSLSGCSISPVAGIVNTSKWDGPISNPGVAPTKKGEACARSILGLFAYGDASIEAAKRSAGITKVATVDHRTENILFFYGDYCTVVYGE